MRALSGVSVHEQPQQTPAPENKVSAVLPLSNFQSDLNRLSAQIQQFRCSPLVVDLSDRKAMAGDTKLDSRAATATTSPPQSPSPVPASQPPLQQFLARRAHAQRLTRQSETLHRAITTELDSTHRLSRFVDVPVSDAMAKGLKLVARVRPASTPATSVPAPERVLVHSTEQLSQLTRQFVSVA
jgi:hypothetical protein